MKLNHSQVLKTIQTRCNNDSNVLGLVVFGSYALNTHNKNSDLDIIISLKLAPTSAQERNEYLDTLLNDLEDTYAVEINPIIVEDSNITTTPLLIEIARYAIILTDKNSTFTTLFSKIKEQYEHKNIELIQKDGYKVVQIH